VCTADTLNFIRVVRIPAPGAHIFYFGEKHFSFILEDRAEGVPWAIITGHLMSLALNKLTVTN